MARLSQEKIDEIRQSVDIVDVIGQYLPLTKKGRNYMAVCPFHDDTHPSLSVSPVKQIYMCFVCHNGGNVFTFLQEYLHISYIEAVMQVAEMGHIDLSEYRLEKKEAPISAENKALYDMHEEAHKIYTYYLNTKAGGLASDYLHSRGFDEETIKTFGVGYAPEKPVLFEAFTKLGFKEIDMVKSGLVIESDRHYDRFNDRVMFPLHDESGRVVGFSGRIYKNASKDAKYMNSPESDIFVKGRVLYNYHRCKEAVKKEGFVYINEGFMDVIAMHRADHRNAIALMGTALTKGHVRMLKRLTHHIVLCLDGDGAGQAAAMKASEFLTNNGFEVRVVLLPEGRDPDEIFSSEGKGGLDEALKDQLSPVDFMMTYECSRLDMRNYDDRRALLNKACVAIGMIEDSIDRAHYIEKLSKLTDFSVEIIKEQLNELPASTPSTMEMDISDVATKVKDTQALLDKYKCAERDLLFYMLNDKAVSDQYEAKVGFMYDDTYRVLASYIVDYYRNHAKMDVANLIDRIGYKQEKLIHALTMISESDLPVKYEPKAIEDYIATIAKNALEMKKEELKRQFEYVLDPQAKAAILQEIIDLGKKPH